MKQVYFIRHGESVSNATYTLMGPNCDLTEAGKKQAVSVAGRMQHVAFDALISSHYPRAQQTAKEISKLTGKPIETCELFHERIWPKELHGLTYDDPHKKEVEDAVFEKMAQNVPSYRYADEENFEDLVARAKQCKDYLESRTEKTIVVVTHGTFLRFLHAYLQFDELLTPQLALRFMMRHATSNTGVTVYELFDADAQKGRWRLRTWMDVAHLAE